MAQWIKLWGIIRALIYIKNTSIGVIILRAHVFTEGSRSSFRIPKVSDVIDLNSFHIYVCGEREETLGRF
jgi:hypothetical protein